ncbi:ROK family transcriptional regulator [Atribacter laminatus]|jgi:predicted NBD/HSP70 family sugar kinase|uniref:N-acetylglucosamine repressor n=1 Tax=Atribacter laminatus TaxID=2847778 RepID=A0A7T1F2B6_ATRLM|nr:ROK family transcriptional regulator [Atribacter laminatus]QPM67620.1 N-acetylglucosamine repressor [Atribacter laminatus]
MNEQRIGDNLTDVKVKNRALVLSLVKKRGLLSRIELARITGLTQPTITNIVNELITSNLLQEVGTSDTKAGRKPILLSFNNRAFYTIAISFSRHGFSVALTDLTPNILFRRDSDYELQENTEIALLELQKEFIHVLEYATQSLRLILGIGVSVPGPVDAETYTILAHPIFLNHKSLDLRSHLKEYDLPIFMANNADAACLHETWNGVAKEIPNMVYFMAGEGVGAGILIDGKLYEGKNKKAGEIGHTSVNIFGPRCVCGNQGCLEMYCNTEKILDKAREAAWFGESQFLHQLLTEKRDELKFHHLIEGAKKNDITCQNILKQLGQYIGVGIVNILNVFDPEVVVIGGEAALAKEFIEEPIRRGIEERLLYRDYITPHIHYSQWGEDIRLLGAASVVLDHFMAGELGRF